MREMCGFWGSVYGKAPIFPRIPAHQTLAVWGFLALLGLYVTGFIAKWLCEKSSHRKALLVREGLWVVFKRLSGGSYALRAMAWKALRYSRASR